MFIRIILFMFLGYVLIKTVRYLNDVFFGSSNRDKSRVHNSQQNKKPINTKDIIEADFEVIDEKDKPNKTEVEE